MARPTLISLAKELGVSRQTVSNVINAPHLVKTSTRERVREHIERSGYRPSAAARALRTNRTKIVAMRILSDLGSLNGSVMDRYLHAATEALEERGYRPVLFTAKSEDEELAALTALFESGVVDAAMLSATTPTDQRPAGLRRLRMPFVAFGRPWGELDAPHPWVDIDNAVGMEQGTRLLRERGHTRIGYIGPSNGAMIDRKRHEGWLNGMEGVDVDLSSLDMVVPEVTQYGYQAMHVLRERGVTAAVCGTDSLALGALSVLYESPVAGFLPAQSIIGYDDSPVAEALGISSVFQPVEQVAPLIVSQMIGELDETDELCERHVLIPSQLHVREGRTLPGRLG
jgi:DNA-binding LacI/PurR family transcriptional regulator